MAKDDSNDEDDSGKTGYKLMAVVASLVGAQVGKRVLTLIWSKATGKEPPANPEHPEVTWAEAAAWAAASGVVVGLFKMVAQRQVAATWHRSTGKLPPGMEKASA